MLFRSAFVAREAYKVFFFEVFDRFLVSIADVGLFLSWFRFSECGMELMVDYSELVFPSNRTQNGQWLYFKIPFISDRLDCEITRTFQKENLPVRIVHKSHTRRQALTQHTTGQTCNRINCPISSTSLCLHRNTVYQLTCKIKRGSVY